MTEPAGDPARSLSRFSAYTSRVLTETSWLAGHCAGRRDPLRYSCSLSFLCFFSWRSIRPPSDSPQARQHMSLPGRDAWGGSSCFLCDPKVCPATTSALWLSPSNSVALWESSFEKWCYLSSLPLTLFHQHKCMNIILGKKYLRAALEKPRYGDNFCFLLWLAGDYFLLLVPLFAPCGMVINERLLLSFPIYKNHLFVSLSSIQKVVFKRS